MHSKGCEESAKTKMEANEKVEEGYKQKRGST